MGITQGVIDFHAFGVQFVGRLSIQDADRVILQKGGDLGYCLSPNVLEILGAIGDPRYNEYRVVTGRGIMSLQCIYCEKILR